MSLDELRARLEQKFPGYLVTEIVLPERASSSTFVHLDSSALKRSKSLYIDQYTGRILGQSSQRNQLTKRIRLFHTQLLMGNAGNQIVTWSTAGLAILGVTGVILWWPRKVFIFRKATSLARLNTDLHHSTGFWTSWAMLLFAATGILIHAARTPEADPFTGQPTSRIETRTRAPLSKIVSAAQQVFPAGSVTRIDFSLSGSAPVLTTVRLPEDHTPLGRSSVKLNPIDAHVLAALSTRSAPLRYNIFKLWARELHTGDICGWPTRILAALCSFALSVLAFTGTMIWLNKKIAFQRGRRALAARNEALQIGPKITFGVKRG
jgi:uncharacterized iron-regulated membrane protein